jgi:hypothetical protein
MGAIINVMRGFEMANKKSPSKPKDKPFREVLDEASKALHEHWVYDTAELFVDCAVATHRLEKMVNRLKNNCGCLAGKEQKVITEITELVRFMEQWKSLASDHLIDRLVCPDEVELRLRRVRKVGFSTRERARMNRRESNEDFFGDTRLLALFEIRPDGVVCCKFAE